MAGTPVIRSGPTTSITRGWFDSGNTPANNAKTLGGKQNVTYPNSSYVIHSAGFNSGAAQTSQVGDCIIGCTMSVTMSDDTVKGPYHASVWGSAVFPIASVAGALAIYTENGTTGGYYDKGDRASYNGGWRQLICDPSGTPDDGVALSVTATLSYVGAYMDLTISHQNMFEAMAASIAWCGREIAIDGGTSTAGNEIDFFGIAARDFLGTRTTTAPFTGNFFGHVTDGGGFIQLKGPLQIGDAAGTNNTYMLVKDTFCLWDDAPVNTKFYRMDITKNGASSTCTVIWGDSATPAPVTIDVGGSTLRWALFTAGATTAEPTAFTAYGCTLKRGRAWELGSTTTIDGGVLQDITDITMDASTKILNNQMIDVKLIYGLPPAAGKLTGSTFSSPSTFCMTVATQTASMTVDY